MKRLITVLMLVSLLVVLTACADASPQAPSHTSTEETQVPTHNVPEDGEPVPEGITKSAVYFTSDISPEGLMAVYDALAWQPTGNVAVKLSTGEPPASNYLDPNLIKDLVQSVDATIVECNTAYGGSRTETAMHMQVAEDHGFTAIADVDILDADGSMELPVEGGTRLETNLVGSHFENYDSYIVLSHFKGHAMAGFGGAIKNISIGLGSQEGKCLIHTSGNSHTSPWGGDQTGFTESMAEAGKSVSDYLGNGERIGSTALAVRLVSCAICGMAAGLLVHICYGKKSFFNFTGFEPRASRDVDPNPFLRFLKNLGRNIKATGGYFLLGVLLSALFQRYVPAENFAELFGKSNEGFGVLMAATIGVPLYACGGGTIPLLQQWLVSGMSMGSAAAFMITGPATKITNLGALKIVLGVRRFIIYIVFVMLFSLMTGLLTNLVV